MYSKGNHVTFYCRSIEEIATFIYGKDCQDYDDWIKKNMASLGNGIRHQKITVNDKGFTLPEILKKLRTGLLNLPDNSICYDAYDEACIKELLKEFDK